MSQEKPLSLSPKRTVAISRGLAVDDLSEILLWDSKEGLCSDSCVYLLEYNPTGDKQVYKVFTPYFIPYIAKYIDLHNALPEFFSFEFQEEDMKLLSVIDSRIMDNYEHGTPVSGLTCIYNGQQHTITKVVARVLRLPDASHIVTDESNGNLIYGPIPFVQGDTIQELYDIPGNRTCAEYYLKKIQHMITLQTGIQFWPNGQVLGAVGINHKIEKIEGHTMYTVVTDIGDSIEMVVKLNP